MTAEQLLARLEKVRRGAHNSWTACCPAHADKSPSLAIRETEDGRILLHCFSGCPVGAVVEAVGLRLTDLFPDQLPHHQKRERAAFPPSDLLRLISFEASVVSIAAYQIEKGKPLARGDVDRLQVAVERIESALEAANVKFV